MDANEAEIKIALSTVSLDKFAVGSLLKQAREQLKQTLKSVEVASGIAASHIWNIEEGRKEVTLERMVKLACFYGFAPGLLIESGIRIDPIGFRKSAADADETREWSKVKGRADAFRRDLVIQYIAGLAIILSYALRSARPTLLVEWFSYPNYRIKARLRVVATHIEYQLAPVHRMQAAHEALLIPATKLTKWKLLEKSDVDDFISSAEAGRLPFQLPWNPMPKPLMAFDLPINLPPQSAEETRFLREMEKRSKAKPRPLQKKAVDL